MIPPSLLPFLTFGGLFAILFLFGGSHLYELSMFLYIQFLSLQPALAMRYNYGQPYKKKHTYLQRATATFLWNLLVYGFGKRRTRPGTPSLDEVDAQWAHGNM